MNAETSHTPVMLTQMLETLSPVDGEVYVDGTFGAGGYSRAILESADCKVIALDRDPSVELFYQPLKAEYGDRISLLQGQFGDMLEILDRNGIDKVDGIVLDIGVSSMQIDQAERGFSFMRDGALDMRMGSDGQSAAEFVNHADEQELADVIYQLGGERKSRRVARAIVNTRAERPIETTGQLAHIIRSVVRASKDGIDPATRTFQAIRIWINDELGELQKVLECSEALLKEGGRLVVVTFHSLEDKIVKDFMNLKSGNVSRLSRHVPLQIQHQEGEVTFERLTRKALKPYETEIKTNVRSRSAKLRAAIRCQKGGSHA